MNRKFVLDNGIRIVGEYLPYKSTVSIGYWLDSGSRDEDEKTSGFYHFIEHMLFKGTERRNYYDIALSIDRVGAQINASTNREATSFYINSRFNHIDLSVDILSDMLLNSNLDPKELKKEKMVILEEIKMYNDNPDEHILDILMSSIFYNHQLGKSILGNIENIYNVRRQSLFEFYKSRYIPCKMVISVAGKFDFDEVKKIILKNRMGGLKGSSDTENNYEEPAFNSTQKMIERKLKQVHFCMGFPGIPRLSKKRYALYLLNSIVGGGMSSKLFQEVREKKGYAYSIYSFNELYRDAGLFVIYCGTSPGNFKKSIELILNVLRNVKKKGIKEIELNQAKEQLFGLLALSNESIEYRMAKLAKQELLFGRFISDDEIIKEIKRVKREDLDGLATDIFSKYSLVSIGPSEHLSYNLKDMTL